MLEINILVQTRPGSNYKIIDVSQNSWRKNITQSLPAVQAISRCDAVSAFHGIGKATCLLTVLIKEEYLKTFGLIKETIESTTLLFRPLKD